MTARGDQHREALLQAFELARESERADEDECHRSVMNGFVIPVIEAGLVDCPACHELIDDCRCAGGPDVDAIVAEFLR